MNLQDVEIIAQWWSFEGGKAACANHWPGDPALSCENCVARTRMDLLGQRATARLEGTQPE